MSVSSELDKEFRDIIYQSNGGKIKRGDLKDSLEESVKDWIRKKRQGL